MSVQHAIVPRLSVDVGYNRRWWGNFSPPSTSSSAAADYDKWTVPVPSNPSCRTAAVVQRSTLRSRRRRRRAGFELPDERDGVRRRAHRVLARRGRQRDRARQRKYQPPGGHVDWSRGTQHVRSVGRSSRPAGQQPLRLVRRHRALADVVPRSRLVRIPKVDVQISSTIRSTLTSAGGDNASNGTSLNGNYQLPNTVVQQTSAGSRRAPRPRRRPRSTLLPSSLYLPRSPYAARYALREDPALRSRRLDAGIDLYNLFNANTATSISRLSSTTGSHAARLVTRPDGDHGAAALPLQRDADVLTRYEKRDNSQLPKGPTPNAS